jgi:hypothetical protein
MASLSLAGSSSDFLGRRRQTILSDPIIWQFIPLGRERRERPRSRGFGDAIAGGEEESWLACLLALQFERTSHQKRIRPTKRLPRIDKEKKEREILNGQYNKAEEEEEEDVVIWQKLLVYVVCGRGAHFVYQLRKKKIERASYS